VSVLGSVVALVVTVVLPIAAVAAIRRRLRGRARHLALIAVVAYVVLIWSAVILVTNTASGDGRPGTAVRGLAAIG
jgi:hypothetical protein